MAPRRAVRGGRLPVRGKAEGRPGRGSLSEGGKICPFGRYAPSLRLRTGTIVEVKVDGLLAKVVIAIGDQRITAIITADAVRELELKPGEQAIALIKATEVMVGRP